MADRDEFLRRLLQHENDLRALVASVVRDVHAREDVFQDVALTLWREADRYDPTRPFGAWARGVAVNLIRQYLTRDRQFPAAFSPEVLQAVIDAFDRTEPEAPRRLRALEECRKLLRDQPRRLLKLRYGLRLSIDEVAGQTRQTRDAVYRALSRIRQALERCIERRLASEERSG